MAVVIGFHAIEEAMKAPQPAGELLFCRKSSRIELLIQNARKHGHRLKHVSAEVLDRMSPSGDHRGVAFVAQKAGLDSSTSLKTHLSHIQSSRPLVIVLDHITDPHNLGAIMRSADQFGVDLLVLPNRNAAHQNQTVQIASAGASEHVRVCEVANLSRGIQELKQNGYWIYGADAKGIPITQVDVSVRCALILGSEGKGMSRIVAESCDEIIRIPTTGHVDSLNVSVSAGILLFEIRRKADFIY